MIAFQILLYIHFPIYIISSQTVANVQTSVHHLVCDWITLKYKSIMMPANQGDAVLRSKIALIAFTPDVSARLARIKHPPAILCRLACRLWRAKEGRKSIFNEIIHLKAYKQTACYSSNKYTRFNELLYILQQTMKRCKMYGSLTRARCGWGVIRAIMGNGKTTRKNTKDYKIQHQLSSKPQKRTQAYATPGA